MTLVRFVFGILGRSPPNPAPSSANVSPQALFLVPLTNLLFPDPSADLNTSAIILRYRLVCVTQTCATLTGWDARANYLLKAYDWSVATNLVV